MGTLYVVGVPADAPDDITLRALRTLAQVRLVVAEKEDFARQLLAHHHIDTPAVAVVDSAMPLTALADGDVALLVPGWSPAPSGPCLELVRAAVQRGFPVLPVPGPVLPITALVLSGLPADSFVYLGILPVQPATRRALLDSVAVQGRTLLALAPPSLLPEIVTDLLDSLGDRPLSVSTSSSQGIVRTWQGTTAQASGSVWAQDLQALCALVIGGTQGSQDHWDEERLRSEILARLDRGLGSKETSRELATQSGWPRRKVYDLAVCLASSRAREEERN